MYSLSSSTDSLLVFMDTALLERVPASAESLQYANGRHRIRNLPAASDLGGIPQPPTANGGNRPPPAKPRSATLSRKHRLRNNNGRHFDSHTNMCIYYSVLGLGSEEYGLEYEVECRV